MASRLSPVDKSCGKFLAGACELCHLRLIPLPVADCTGTHSHVVVIHSLMWPCIPQCFKWDDHFQPPLACQANLHSLCNPPPSRLGRVIIFLGSTLTSEGKYKSTRLHCTSIHLVRCILLITASWATWGKRQDQGATWEQTICCAAHSHSTQGLPSILGCMGHPGFSILFLSDDNSDQTGCTKLVLILKM